MKFLSCISMALIVVSSFAEGAPLQDDESSPEVYVDISKRAQKNAVKHDGGKLVGGLTYSMFSSEATIKGRSVQTEKNFNNFMLTLGAEYTKKIKKKFLIGGSVLLDFWKSNKKTGDWQSFNYEYYDRRGPEFWNFGNLEAELKTPFVTPEFALKGGYIFQNMGTVAYLKLGMQRLQSDYHYKVSGIEICSVKAIKLIPMVGIGGQRRFNKKLGVQFELNFPFKRDFDRQADTVYHKIRLGRKTLRVMATYSVPDLKK